MESPGIPGRFILAPAPFDTQCARQPSCGQLAALGKMQVSGESYWLIDKRKAGTKPPCTGEDPMATPPSQIGEVLHFKLETT